MRLSIVPKTSTPKAVPVIDERRAAIRADTRQGEAGVATKLVASSRKSAKKRLAIIRAAIEIINLKSYVLATMTEIAASLDLRDGTLYYYFPSKEALVYACHVSSLERFERLLVDAISGPGTGAARLHGFLHGMLDDSDRHGPQLYFGDHSYLKAPERDAVDAWAARLTAMLEQLIRDGMRDGSIASCEPQLVVQLLLGMLIWLAKWVPAVEGLTVDRLMAAISVVGLKGLETRTP